MTTTNEMTRRLQGVGLVAAKLVSDVVVGDRLAWNLGYVSTVVGVERVSPAFVAVTTISDRDGARWTRRMKLTRTVAFCEAR